MSTTQIWIWWTPGDPNLKQRMTKILEGGLIFGSKLLSSFLMSAIYSFLKYLCYRQTSRGKVKFITPVWIASARPIFWPFSTFFGFWFILWKPHWARSTNQPLCYVRLRRQVNIKTADLALTSITSRSQQTLSQESFMRKWWLSFEVETWNFTKNKILKLVNSRKTNFLFTGLNLNRIIQKKKRQKKAHFMDDASKQGAICYIFKCWNLVVVCPPPSKFLATRLSFLVLFSLHT